MKSIVPALALTVLLTGCIPAQQQANYSQQTEIGRAYDEFTVICANRFKPNTEQHKKCVTQNLLEYARYIDARAASQPRGFTCISDNISGTTVTFCD